MNEPAKPPRKTYKCPTCGSIGVLAGEETWQDYENGDPVVFAFPTAHTFGPDYQKRKGLDVHLTCSQCKESVPRSTLTVADDDEPLTVIPLEE